MSEYRFLTTWCLEAPIEPVWDAIHDSERWPQWWRGVERVVELRPPDEDDTGQIVLVAPIARPIFAWNHDYVMRNGAIGLSRLLGGRLLTASGGIVREI